MTRPSLPNDIEALKDLVIENYRRAELYKSRFENLTRKHFGPSSEKLQDSPGQQQLFDLPSEPEATPEMPIANAAVEVLPVKKRNGGGRKRLPPELRRERREYTLPEEQRKCSCCVSVRPTPCRRF
jgi:transposase